MAEQVSTNEDINDLYDNLTGTQKCAILMMLLGEDEAAEILKNLGPKEVQQLGKEMYSVAGLDQDTVNQVLDEFLAIIKTQNYKHAKMSGVSENNARKLAFAPHLNIGVFSLMKNSTCWKVWQENLSKVLQKGRIFGSEGLAINMSVYLNEIPTEFLPLNHNWITSHLLPIYDEKNKIFRRI